MDKVEFFNRHAAAWDGAEADGIDIRLERVVSLAKVESGERILDVGTGTGVLIPHLLKAAGQRGSITAVDISPRMIETARAKQFPGNVEFLTADIQESGLPDASFDRVICNAVFPHFDNKQRALSEIRRMLRPGGMLVISHPIGREAVNNLHRNSGPAVAADRVPPSGEMRRMLEEAGFTDIRVLDEPHFHLASAVRPDR